MKKILLTFFIFLFLWLSIMPVASQDDYVCDPAVEFFRGFAPSICVEQAASVLIMARPKERVRVYLAREAFTMPWLTARWGNPTRIGSNPSVYYWAKAKPFRRALAFKLSGLYGFDVLIVLA